MMVQRRNWKLYIGVIVTILAISIVIFHEYIFYGHDFLFRGTASDLVRANLPTYYELYDNLTSGWSFWSWNMGIGTSVLTHADVMLDPFTYILFIFGRSHIPDMMILLFVAKIICEGLSFSLYLKYFKLDDRAIFVGAVLYAFCGYSLIMGQNLALGTILVYFPLLLLGIEKMVREKKVGVLLVSLLLISLLSYYYLYVSGLVIFFYLIARSIYEKDSWNIIVVRVFMLIIIAGIAIGLSAVTLLPQLKLVRNSARTVVSDVTGMGYLLKPQLGVLFTTLLRLFGNDILGNGLVDDYLGSPKDYYQLATFGTGLSVVLLFQIWTDMEKKRKKMIIFVVTGISIATVFPVFSYAMNAFSTVNYRWSFIINILMISFVVYAVDALLKKKYLDAKRLCHGIAATYGLVFGSMFLYAGLICQNDYFDILNKIFLAGRKSLILLTCEMIMMVSLCAAIKNKKEGKRYDSLIVFCVLCMIMFEEVGNYFTWYNIENEIWNYSGDQGEAYEDESAEIIQKIQKDNPGFYRINKSFDSVYDNDGIPSLNDAMVQQYYGLKCYNSVNNAEYIRFLQTLGVYVCNPLVKDTYIKMEKAPEMVTGQDLNFIPGVYDDYELMSYLGVKYYLTNDINEVVPDYFTYLPQYSSESVLVYENQAYYPLAYINENVANADEFESLTVQEKKTTLMQHTIVEGQSDSSQVGSMDFSDYAKLQREKFELIHFSADDIEFEIKDVKTKSYLSLLMPYDSDWEIFVDGVKVNSQKVNISLLGAQIMQGTHMVRLHYAPSAVKLGGVLSGGCAVFLLICYMILRKGKCSIAVIMQRMESKLQWLDVFGKIEKKLSECKILGILCINLLIVASGIYYLKTTRLVAKVPKQNNTIVEDGWNQYLSAGIREDALAVNIWYLQSEANEPQRVERGVTANLPEDCEMGVEYVFCYDSENLMIEVVGKDTNNNPQIWIRQWAKEVGWTDYQIVSVK